MVMLLGDGMDVVIEEDMDGDAAGDGMAVVIEEDMDGVAAG